MTTVPMTTVTLPERDRTSGLDLGLDLRLFGPLAVHLGAAGPLPPLRTRKGQWLLALLVLRAGRDVERTWLAATLWPDSPEPQALYNLRRSLSDLRHALGPEAARVGAATPHTLCLDLMGVTVDVLAFDAATIRGDAASLEAAVLLYTGPLLEGCLEEWVFPERERREQVFLGALETLAACAMASGDQGASERYLRRLVTADPLRESARCALMDVLVKRGSPAEALACFRDLRLLLHEEMDVEPDSETSALFQQIRAESLRPAPKAGICRSGAAYAPVPSRGPPLLHTVLRHFPRPLTEFVGREPAVCEVGERLRTTRLLTLTGTGGVGKTRLASRIAETIAEDYCDGAWFVDMNALSDPALVPQATARALDLPEEHGHDFAAVVDSTRSLTKVLADFLSSRHLLLVLDGCEHVLAACANLADTLLERCPHLRILATSRQALGVGGEAAWRVPSLSLPDDSVLDHFAVAAPREEGWQEALLRYEAVRLFAKRAVVVSPAFVLNEQSAPAVLQVCRRLEGIPLALELAAARLNVLSPQQIAARLNDVFPLLTGGSRTAPPRQQTLRATMDWSYDLLDEAERALLCRLSVFVGKFTLDAVRPVCFGGVRGSEDAAHDWETLDLLSRLVNQSLVVCETTAQAPAANGGAAATASSGQTGYRLLETVRQYGRDRLNESGETRATRERHRDWFLGLAEGGGTDQTDLTR